MAEDNDKLLSDEELSAIEDMVASGDLGGEGYNVGVAASTYDLTLQDTSVGVNVTAIEQINDRFHRFMRAGLLEELRYNARLQPGRIEIIRYGDYVQSTSPPLSVNVTKSIRCAVSVWLSSILKLSLAAWIIGLAGRQSR